MLNMMFLFNKIHTHEFPTQKKYVLIVQNEACSKQVQTNS